MNKELQKLLLTQQEEQSYHLPMEAEYSFYPGGSQMGIWSY